MAGPSLPLFGKTKKVERAIDEFLDAVSEAGIRFGKAVNGYVATGCVDDDCQRNQQRVTEIEKRCDNLRRSIEAVLLTQMLIPETRGDVLSLIDLLDGLVDRVKRELLSMTIETPQLPAHLHDDLARLVEAICACIDEMVRGSRAFFTDQNAVRDHVHKIGIHESEADAMSIRMKQSIFSSDLDLAEKMMLRDFIDSLDRIADQAEDIGDQLSIFTLRRSF
jgi:uncharacterized protein